MNHQPTSVTINDQPLSLDQVRAACAGPVSIQMSDESIAAIARSRETITGLLDSGRPIYGVNTGFGKLAKERIDNDHLAELQLNIVRSHAAGVGEPLKPEIVRLILLLKLKSLAAGFSGVRIEVIQLIADLLGKDILPVIPGQGSVGASGDLAPLAHMALALIGEGSVIFQGEQVDTLKAFEKAGLRPVELKAKEGLGLLNGTQVSTALALFGLLESEHLLRAAMVAGAMSVEAIKGSHTPFDPRIHQLRAHRGQNVTAEKYRALLNGSDICASHVHCDRVQDPYSFRCQPQVMGACLDLMQTATQTLLIEANAVTDNPLVFSDDNSVLSGGNFHAEPVAFAADTIALAIAEIGSLSERRVAALIDPGISLLPAFITEQAGLNSGYMLAQVTAAALASENKQRAAPASVDSIPTSANQEDHVSMATHASLRLQKMNANLAYIIAVEFLAAAEGIEFHRPLTSSDVIESVHQQIRAKVSRREHDREFSQDIETVKQLVDAPEIANLIKPLIG